MKQIILIYTLFSFNYINAQQRQKDIEKENLKSRVKSYTQFAYKALLDSGEIKKGDRIHRYMSDNRTIFNKNGGTIEKEFYSPDDDLNHRYENKYKNDNLIGTHSYYSGKLVKKTSYKYDQKNNITETKMYNPKQELLFRYTYQYNNAGNKIKNYWYDQEGNLLEHETFSYNKKGELLEIRKYEKKYLKQKGVYHYKNGFKYETTNFFKKDGSVKKKNVSVYNSINKKTEIYSYQPKDVLTNVNIYKYNGNGEIIERKSHSSDGMIGYNTEESRQQIEFENVYTFEYKYDEKGNWIKVIQYKNYIPIKIIERQFEYYK